MEATKSALVHHIWLIWRTHSCCYYLKDKNMALVVVMQFGMP